MREHRDEIVDIVRAHGGRTVRVFGSTAAGSDTQDSDLDLLVDTAPGTSLVDVMRMELDLEDLLEVRVDIVHDDGRGPVVESARATARPL
nr:nucleotidyltransferase domain-containing protein [Cellulomonas uda]